MDIVIALALQQELTTFIFTEGSDVCRPEAIPEALNALRLFGRVQIYGQANAPSYLSDSFSHLERVMNGMQLPGERFMFETKKIGDGAMSVIITRRKE